MICGALTDLILVNDSYALTTLQETRQHADVRYAFIVDRRGRSLTPAWLPLIVGATRFCRTIMVHKIQHGRRLAWDTAVPIRRAGLARVGLSDVGVQQGQSVTGQLLLTTVLSVIGITAAAFSLDTTRPILDLAKAAQAVGRGDFAPRVPRWADDEIGDLSDSFNAMTRALAKAAEERAEREQLRARYVSGVIAAQEEERKRIARELHDSASQSVTSLMVGMKALSDACDSPVLRQRADELRGVAAHTLDEIHNLALQLRPSVLDDLGLPAALERYVADCRGRFHLRIDLAIRGLGETRLPPELETALYRIVQESLTNVARHAQAATASV